MDTEDIRRRLGEAGSVVDAGIAWMERNAKVTADMDVPVLSAAAKMLQPLYVGVRAAVANATSGGGKYYQPEVRDERYFSKDALREIAANIDASGGRGTTRYRYSGLGGGRGMFGSAAAVEAAQTLGGSTIVGDRLVDKFDVDRRDPYGANDDLRAIHPALGAFADAAHRAVGAIFGSDRDPDAGKVRTEIPMSEIDKYRRRSASKAGDSRFATSHAFLATDRVPDSVFGIPVVSRREDYTEADLAFFKEHPEAGGYYDMEDGNEGTSPDEEVPAQGLGEVQPGEPAGEGVPQMAEKAGKTGKTYDTVIPKEREAEYQAWKAKYAPNDSGYDYDLRGAFLEGLLPDPKTGHWSDKYKKPNHPTFSVESKYAVGSDANLAGTWDGETYVPNPARSHELAIREVLPFIKRHEGFRRRAYLDSVGKWTIGYGQTEIDGRPVRAGDVITEAAASEFVERRVRENAAELYKNSSWTNAASPKALAALYDVAYNAGVSALYREKSPSLNRNGEAAAGTNAVDAAIWREIPTYIRAGGRVLEGLRNRRNDAIRTWKEE